MDVYLDNNATTRPLESVTDAMVGMLRDSFANPSSLHLPGRKVRAVIEHSRECVVAMIGCRTPSEVVFTSGGTESINQAFFIANELQRRGSPHIIISAVEHAAVMEAAQFYRERGSQVHTVGVDRDGMLNLPELQDALSKAPKGSFVSLMLANNETGVLFPVAEASKLCRHHGAYLHVDAIQAVGKLPVSVQELQCHFLSLSAHKFHGPKGVGALYIRHGAPRQALIKGHQENGARGGTENVPGIIGMGVAAQAILDSIPEDAQRIRSLRDQMEAAILHAIPTAQVNGDEKMRLCSTSNIFFPGKDSASMVEQLSARGIHVSAGAACTTGGKSSHVLRAMGLGDKRANASLRFSLSKLTSESDIVAAISAMKQVFASSLDVYRVS